jgi:hypothetical protein
VLLVEARNLLPAAGVLIPTECQTYVHTSDCG